FPAGRSVLRLALTLSEWYDGGRDCTGYLTNPPQTRPSPSFRRASMTGSRAPESALHRPLSRRTFLPIGTLGFAELALPALRPAPAASRVPTLTGRGRRRTRTCSI